MAKALFSTDRNELANLADLSPIAPGGIVSKPLLDTGPLKQILFAMDTGQSISEHRAPFSATVHVLTGRLRFVVGGKEHDLGPNDWLIMPPDEPHNLIADEPVCFLLTLIKGE